MRRLLRWLSVHPRLCRAGLALGLLALIVALSFVVPTPYQLIRPGPVQDTNTLVEPAPEHTTGAFYLTSIYSERASAAAWLYAQSNPEAGLIPREQVRPRHLNDQQYRRLLSTMMADSKIAAKVVALRAAGYEVTVTGHGTQVREVVQGSPAAGVLQIGDVIVAAEGQEVTSASDLIAIIRQHRPGDRLTLEVVRGGTSRSVTIVAAESPRERGRARIGVVIVTHRVVYEFPRKLAIKTKNLGGPSAGLMFALAIYNAITPGDLTGGHRIAGTGTISMEGKVGNVGGIKYKVRSAEKAQAEYFLVPEREADAARQAARTIEVVPVKTFDEALTFVKSLNRVALDAAMLARHRVPGAAALLFGGTLATA